VTVQQENLDLANRAFAAWTEGDREGTLEMFDDEITVEVPNELANAGTFRGLEEFMRWNKEWDEAWDRYEMTVKEQEPLGQRHVVSLVHQRAVGALTGVPVEMDIGWLTEIRDGKIRAMRLCTSMEEARKVGEEREAAA
jgi:ketosteroid isomerase-like protein